MVGFSKLGLYKPKTMSIIKVSLSAQLLSLVYRNVFHKIVALHNSDKSCKGFEPCTIRSNFDTRLRIQGPDSLLIHHRHYPFGLCSYKLSQ